MVVRRVRMMGGALLYRVGLQLTDFRISLLKNHGNGKPLSMITPRTHAGPWRRAAPKAQDGCGEAAGPQFSILKSQFLSFYHKKKISTDSRTTKRMVAPYIMQMACLIWSALRGVSGSPMYSRNSGFPS